MDREADTRKGMTAGRMPVRIAETAAAPAETKPTVDPVADMADDIAETEPNQKRELLLNMALEATDQERAQSAILRGGIDDNGQWELIVRYHGDPRELYVSETTRVEPLWSGYAIVWTEKEQIPALTALQIVEYMELPKRLYAEIQVGKVASCITPLQRVPVTEEGWEEGEPAEEEPAEEDSVEEELAEEESGEEDEVTENTCSEEAIQGILQAGSMAPLYGQGVLLAVIDSGIDYTMPEFLRPDGSSRILRLWDQTLNRMFTREEIDAALRETSTQMRQQMVPTTDLSGHGTQVAAIATAVAPESDLLIVKLGIPGERSFPRTTELMRGVHDVLAFARDRNQPVAVNISFGNNYGSHDGTAILETFLDELAGSCRCNLIVGSGNEGAEAGHCSGTLENPVPGRNMSQEITWSIGPYESAPS